jgi:HSP20 family molecular chaperone IbpA
MSSNLRPINFTNVELEAARRKTAAKRADELKKLEDNYDKAENQAKLQSDERVKEIRDDNQTKLIMEMGDKEEKLLKLKQSYDQTRDLIDLEKQQYYQSIEDQKQDRKHAHEQNMQTLHKTHTEDSQELNHNLTMELRDIHQNAQKQEHKSVQEHKIKSANIKRDNATSLVKDYYAFQDHKYNQGVQNQLALDNQRNTFKTEFRTKENTHNSKYQTQAIRHQAELDAEKKQNEITIETSRLDFEKKYQGLVAQQAENLANLQDHVDHSISKIKLAETKNKEKIANRNEDQFYQGSVIKTDVLDQGDHYLIKIPLPAHEAAQATLTGHERNLKLNFSRLSDNEVKLEDGSINKTKRSESIMKQFQVNDVINPKKIEKKFEDGVVTYKIAKL